MEPGQAPRRIYKRDARLHRAGFRPAWLALGVPSFLAGAYLCAVGTDLLAAPVEVAAPRAVVASTGVGLALFGGLLVVRALRGLFHRWRMRVRRGRHPGQPWRSDFPWDPEGVGDEPAGRLATQAAGVLTVWCLVTPFVWMALAIPELPWIGKAVVAGAVCLALLLTGLLLRGVAELVRYGSSRIVFGSFPFSPGGKLAVAFLRPRFATLTATLRYVEERFEAEEAGESGTRIDHAAYVHHEEVRKVSAPPGLVAVGIEFELPARPDWVTQLTGGWSVRYWELLVQADEPGVEFSAAFPLPVYQGEGTPAPNPRFQEVLEEARERR